MRSPISPINLARVCAAPDTALAGGAHPHPETVAEIVTYRLQGGADPQAHLAAARQTMPFLRSTGAVINRTLSRDDTGLWTDHILWTSLKAAKQTEAMAMQRPEFKTFFSMIDETGLTLGHAPVMLQMD